MADNLYDEFGNYIGESLDDEEEIVYEDNKDEDDEHQQNGNGRQQYNDDEAHIEETNDEDEMNIDQQNDIQISTSSAIVLHEDKQYFPDATDVYKGVEVMVQDEDTQPLSKPIIDPKKNKTFTITEKDYPATTYSKQFLTDLSTFPQFIRNVSLIGQLHHGKTSFMDMLFQQTHESKWLNSKPMRYTDTRIDEQERLISIKSTPMSLVLPNSKDKSFLINILDTPGHPNFLDEVTASIALSDIAVVVIDALEGVMMQTERLIKHAVSQGLQICVIINKMDRLILELKLPPVDAYFKLKHTIDEVNSILEICSHGSSTGNDDITGSGSTTIRVSPELGNVIFASSEMGWCFSLESFASIYSNEYYGGSFKSSEFAKRLWGDLYFNPVTRVFRKQSTGPDQVRSFVHFILNPLYKIVSTVISEEKPKVESVLTELGIRLSKETYQLDIRPLLRVALGSFFGGKSNAFVDMLERLRSPIDNAANKVSRIYTGPLNGEYGRSLNECDPNGPLLIYITKLLTKSNGKGFDCLGRIMSGTCYKQQSVRVLREKYSPDVNDEDMEYATIESVNIGEARYSIEIEKAQAGMWVLLDGLDGPIIKTATITSEKDISSSDDEDRAHTFRPLQFINKSVCKVAIEPINPSELPKMLDGLRSIDKSYPMAITKAEESGEHVIIGTGELYLDCILHDLRLMYTEIEIKVDDPVITLAETIVETSSIKCYTDTQNQKNRLTMIAEPLEKGLANDIENGMVKLDWPKKKRSEFFQSNYDWDVLAANSIWAFGPDMNGPNVLLNDTLPTEVNRSLLLSISDSVVRGFQWATKEGPLVDEPIRGVKFKLLDATISSEPIQRSSGHIVPAARSVTHSSFLVSTPRLMEPVFQVEIIAPIDCLNAIENVLTRRRGHIVSDHPKPGTPLHITKALIPVLDSYGFETDLRAHTQGQAFCLSTFDHWQIVPGDPLDKSIKLRPLEPSPQPHLARELLIKTRKRKGLSEDVNFSKHFDNQLLLSISQNNNQYQ